MTAGIKPNLMLPFVEGDGKRKRRPLADVRVLLGEAEDEPAGSARSVLRFQGATETAWRRDIDSMEASIKDSEFDLILIDQDLPGGTALDFVRRVRRGIIGRNPFVCIIIMRWHPTRADADLALMSGADDLIAKPIAAMAIAARARLLTERRKPYIAADGYIGPVRTNMSGSMAKAEPFEPPNTLLAQASGKPIKPEVLQKALEQAQDTASASLIETAAANFGGLARQLKAKLEEDDAAAVDAVTASLKIVGEDLRDSVEGSCHAKLLPVVLRLNALLDLAQLGQPDAPRAAILITEMSEAVARTLRGRPDDITALSEDLLTQIDARFPAVAAAIATPES